LTSLSIGKYYNAQIADNVIHEDTAKELALMLSENKRLKWLNISRLYISYRIKPNQR